MPNDLEPCVKRTTHFSWSGRKNCGMVSLSARELTHAATSTVGTSLQISSAGAVTYRGAGH